MNTAAEKAAALRALHVPGDPLVLPNAWDAASARVVAELFPAVATASAAVAPSLGYDDGEDMPADEAFAAVARVARAVDVPVTADVERGYRLPPAEIAARLADAGAVGCNLEDSDPATGALVGQAEQVEFLGAVRAADPALVVNARVDVFLHGSGSFDEGVERALAYLAAGADCVYPIFLPEADVERFCRAVRGPVNVGLGPGAPAPAELGRRGAARISFGPGVQRLLMGRLRALVAGIRDGRSPFDA
ncbi:isocitrate lyase/PEP mutase family protein [Saccharothrix algeriensis]|uniref:2-methylisocitrate lyase-like PEP mutase family enzyme n=1 Tax=Saccharothrix algeriensis TaxID=173560 RepID=A0A8T8I0M4_9PSEU|nr:isocitrate lyase/phosphoenolpyruvate mutase family protein [Saccharothrix algeriensis]MBM7809160.1 2-methylisocitrate lyase-like PEP mutase family enzyme [Saccharothrix algeriensis]QTR03524.1 isocitrate lyase/phosphoenolpyruvate mutase family protein [Saccharothrix algeriensis]